MNYKTDYISVKEAAKEWNISERRVRALCADGKIEGAVRVGGWTWSIPKGSSRPADGRSIRYMKNRDLRTGVQDYSAVNRIRSTFRKTTLSDTEKASVIQNAFLYSDIPVTVSQILDVFKFKLQNVALQTQLVALNAKYAFSLVSAPLTESVVTNVNKRLIVSLDKDDASPFNNSFSEKELEALVLQFNTSWAPLHPVARTAFLFSELIRLNLFKRANTETAFVILNSLLLANRIPPAIFSGEDISELKAALTSVAIRGNSGKLVTLILEACCRK